VVVVGGWLAGYAAGCPRLISRAVWPSPGGTSEIRRIHLGWPLTELRKAMLARVTAAAGVRVMARWAFAASGRAAQLGRMA